MQKPYDKLKKILRATVFTVIFALIFAFLSQGFIPSGSENEDGMESRISKAYRGEPKGTIDVMFIGNSDIYRGVSPVDLYHSTGITSAIAGEPGKKFSKVNKDIKDILKYQKPKIIALETDCMFSEKNPVLSKASAAISHMDSSTHKADMSPHGRRIQNRSTDNSATFSFADKINSLFSKCSDMFNKIQHYARHGDNALIAAVNYKYPLIKYHDNYCNLKLSNFFDPLRKYTFFNKGMAYSDKVKAYEGGKSYMKKDREIPTAIDTQTERQFKVIADTCKQNDIRLVLMTVPSANTWSSGKHKAIQDLADKYDLTYYDYNTDFPKGFNWKTDSTDGGNHLNYSGAKKVTDDIANKMTSEIGMTPSKISAKDKERWNSDYNNFHNKIASQSQKSK